MGERFNLRLISVFVALAALICAAVLLGAVPESNELNIENVIFLMDSDIRNPEYALQQGITGYLEITLPPDSPSLLSSIGGEVNVDILLHFVSYTPEVTEARVNIDQNSRVGVGENDLFWDETVSYNLSGNISIKAGETIPLTMSIRLVVNFQRSTAAIPLEPVGITAHVAPIGDNFRNWVPIINGLGWKETAFY